MTKPLRITAAVAVAGLSVLRTIESFPLPDRAWVSLLVLLLLTAAVGATMVRLLGPELSRIVSRPDLLVPLGLLLLALALLDFAVAPVAAFTTSFLSVDLGSLAVGVSVFLLFVIVANTAYLAWETKLVWRAVREEPIDGTAGPRLAARHFLRALAVGTFGTVGSLLLFALVLPVFTGIGGFAVLLLFPVALAFNLLTAALVLVVLEEEGGGLRERFAAGLAAGVAGWRRWWAPVTIQLVLLGGLYFVPYRFTDTVNETRGSRFSTTRTSYSGWSAGSVVKWTGGYQDDSSWPAEVGEAWKTPVPPIVAYLSTLVFAVLAIAVKLRIASRLRA